mmetsp:Transcript_18226/g.51925  ORF Transcript_18226/g.51925 Transcript_18226/m.51925 type:complete len:241 (-) Transcript_18226:2683-3405(-)
MVQQLHAVADQAANVLRLGRIGQPVQILDDVIHLRRAAPPGFRLRLELGSNQVHAFLGHGRRFLLALEPLDVVVQGHDLVVLLLANVLQLLVDALGLLLACGLRLLQDLHDLLQVRVVRFLRVLQLLRRLGHVRLAPGLHQVLLLPQRRTFLRGNLLLLLQIVLQPRNLSIARRLDGLQLLLGDRQLVVELHVLVLVGPSHLRVLSLELKHLLGQAFVDLLQLGDSASRLQRTGFRLLQT